MRDLMTGNPKLKEMGFKEEAWDTMPLQPVSRDNANGQTSILTVTIRKLCSILLLTERYS